ncbi:MAG: BF3164 family lipoprotein [Bacteroidota bacterium]
MALWKSYAYYYGDYKRVNNVGVSSSKTNLNAFTDVESNDSGVYVLYCGKSRAKDGDNALNSRSILVYDWAGNPKIRYELDREIKKMSLDTQRRIIYAYSDNPSTFFPEIISFEY